MPTTRHVTAGRVTRTPAVYRTHSSNIATHKLTTACRHFLDISIRLQTTATTHVHCAVKYTNHETAARNYVRDVITLEIRHVHQTDRHLPMHTCWLVTALIHGGDTHLHRLLCVACCLTFSALTLACQKGHPAQLSANILFLGDATQPGISLKKCWTNNNEVCVDAIPVTRVVVSVSTSRSRDGLETYQRLVSVSSRRKLSTSRSRLGLGH